ncbi:MAG TPA: cytochrome c peroxidase [Verrucomicrobiae bacterium]|jgi:cytochrome c peroxidase|nr:cytochrome c peroxidase [Verrucomicrobiae bacterium]
MQSKYVRKIAALAAVFAFKSSLASAQIPANASLSIVTAVSSNSITINDPSNRVWIMMTSTNLAAWNEQGAWKVFNGTFHQSFTNGSGSIFYRATYDPAQQTVLDTALLLPSALFDYIPVLPQDFLVPPISVQDNTPATNAITDAGAQLGRVLFYDKRLSTNQTISCSSCHQAAHGFADPRTVSVGFDGSLGTRNAMGLNNARYYQRGHFFWDERAATLEDQVLQPIQNPIEMGMTLPTLVSRLAGEPFYTNLFTQVFGTPAVTTNRISVALAQFVRSIVTTNSRYDQGVSIGFTNLTTQENLGRQIFFGQVGKATCSLCHTTDIEVAANIFNNGLEFPYVDKGVGGITARAQDMGLFKVPSLRNIELTAPYMHDGRFTNLDQVVEFYNSEIVSNANLSPPLRGPGGTPLRLNLTTAQKSALVAFLKTLTDTTATMDARFSDPFNYGN